ncbi:MAG: beta-ketoacyl-[acyl-carrier-protein] synthase II, partial [Hydrogenophaga sp.]|nr:beta-ketoacyl-[acyl-carrier-protein] synthase II [Hydrogenophaga sp.]
AALFGDQVPCSSTKGATGHTLGAAGAIEAIIAMQSIAEDWIPGSPGTGAVDPAMAIDYRCAGQDAPVRVALSNSFGFGGSNCALVLGGQAS